MDINNIHSYEDYEEFKKTTILRYPEFVSFYKIPEDFIGWCRIHDSRDEFTQVVFVRNKQYDSCPNITTPNYYVMSNDFNTTEYCSYHKVGTWHNLNGPARRWASTPRSSYIIEDEIYDEENYWKHPLVASNLLNNIIKVLG